MSLNSTGSKLTYKVYADFECIGGVTVFNIDNNKSVSWAANQRIK